MNIHIHPIRIYYEDTDFSGFVYHGAYVRFFERGRSEFIRDLGINHVDMLAGAYGTPAFFAVRRMSIDFHAPAKIDDLLEVRTRIAHATGARLKLKQEIYRNDIFLVEAHVEIVCLSVAGNKPTRLPKGVVENL